MGLRYLVSALVLSLALAIGPSAHAQTQTGEVFGKVTDHSGGILPGATVTIDSPALLTPRSAATIETGAYRFPNIPIGVYAVRFELAGFKTLVRDGVRIEIRLHRRDQREARDLGGPGNGHGVAAEPGRRHHARRRRAQTFNARAPREHSVRARSVGACSRRRPAMVMNQQNVGGNKSGQQSTFTVHGTSRATRCGTSTASPSPTWRRRSSSVYFDFDAFEEIQIQTGGSDASVQTGGVNLNLVTQSGGNALRGSGRSSWSDNDYQADNITDELRAQGAGSRQPGQEHQGLRRSRSAARS